jgi:DNA-directed RNA polymerase sigma subunit (sigma70/sigma32)
MLRPPRVPAPPSRRQREAAATVRAAVLLVLSPEERGVVSRRFGLEGDGVADLQAVADDLGLSYPEALRRFRSAMVKLGATPALQRARDAVCGAEARA